MAGCVPATTEIANIVAGHGEVSLEVALAALATAPGLVIVSKRIGLWDKLSPVAKDEFEMLDEDKPDGWWLAMQHRVPAAVMTGARVVWRHGRKTHANAGYAVGPVPIIGSTRHELGVRSPMLDEETGQLV